MSTEGGVVLTFSAREALVQVLQLPLQQREVVWLHLDDEWTAAEIGEILGLTEDEVRESWEQACASIRAFIGRTRRARSPLWDGLGSDPASGQEVAGDQDVKGLLRDAERAIPSARTEPLTIEQLFESEGLLATVDHVEQSMRSATDSTSNEPSELTHHPQMSIHEASTDGKQRRNGRKRSQTGAHIRQPRYSVLMPITALVAVCLVLLTMMTAVLIINRSLVAETSEASAIASKASASFIFPVDSQGVASPLNVTGMAQIPAGEALWLLLKPNGDSNYYVTTDSQIAVDVTGRWDSRLHLGRGSCDVGKDYELIAVSAPRGGAIETGIANRPLGEYSARLDNVPADTTLLDQVNIHLDEYAGNRVC